MISVSRFNQLCVDIKTAIPEINQHILVTDEGHAVSKLKDKPGVILVAIIPSSDRDGQPGQGVDRNSTWLFIVEKDKLGQPDLQELQQYDKLQQIILKVRGYIEEKCAEGIPLLGRYVASANKIDPEYREFGGFNGWSMSLVF